MKCPEKWVSTRREHDDRWHRCKFRLEEDHQLHVCHCGVIKPYN